jgi:hypothetical protein
MGFADDVGKFCLKARLKEDTLVRKVVLDVTSELVKRSPVDTGLFRANWFVSNGSPTMETTRTPDKTGLVSVGRAHLAASYLKAGGVTYIMNNLPYALPLEYGHSTQAPAGMVRITVSRWQAIVDRAAKTLGP